MAIVYQHRRNDTNEIFYIGIGKNKKRMNSKSSRNKHWYGIVNKHGYTAEIVLDNTHINQCKQIEIMLISKYGRKDTEGGTLVNLTDGGDGNYNMKVSAETRKKQSEIAKGRIMSNITRNKLSKIASNISAETRKKMSESKLGKIPWNKGKNTGTMSEETKLKMSISQTNRRKREKL